MRAWLGCVREKRGIPQETTMVGLPEWSARPLIAIRDEEIKDNAIRHVENLLKKRNYLLSGPVVVHAQHLIDDRVNLVYQVLRSHNLVSFKQFPFFHNSNTSLIARTSADNLPLCIQVYMLIYIACGYIHYMDELTLDAMPPTSIRVKTETRDRLNAVGFRNESYDDIINRVLDTLSDQSRSLNNKQ
jgi:hypothetical protein